MCFLNYQSPLNTNKNKAVLQNRAKREAEYGFKPLLKTILAYFLRVKITLNIYRRIEANFILCCSHFYLNIKYV